MIYSFHLPQTDIKYAICEKPKKWLAQIHVLIPSKWLWTIVHGLLYGLIQRAGEHGHFKSHGLMPLVWTCLKCLKSFELDQEIWTFSNVICTLSFERVEISIS